MNDQEKLQLQKLITANNAEDTTEQIRELKHSLKIKADVETLHRLKQQLYEDKEQFDQVAMKKCHFLYNHYTDIYHKIVNDTLNMQIFEQFLNVLYDIENGEIDQHEGSFKVGKLLKQIYIDSALKEGEKREENREEPRNKGSGMTWRQYKRNSH